LVTVTLHCSGEITERSLWSTTVSERCPAPACYVSDFTNWAGTNRADNTGDGTATVEARYADGIHMACITCCKICIYSELSIDFRGFEKDKFVE